MTKHVEVCADDYKVDQQIQVDLGPGVCMIIGDLGDPHLGTDVVRGASQNLFQDPL